MTSPEAMKANVQNGFPVAPRFSVSADPEAAATSPIVSVVDRLAKRNLLKGWPRPPVPDEQQPVHEAWRFSGRWWNKPVPVSRARPWTRG